VREGIRGRVGVCSVEKGELYLLGLEEKVLSSV